MPISRNLSPLACRGIQRAGDYWIPGGDGFPSFSESLSLPEVDRLADYITRVELKDLQLLCCVLALLPGPLLRTVLRFCDGSAEWPDDGPVGGLLREIRFGLKGIVMTLYYSDPTGEGAVHRQIRWDPKCGESKEKSLLVGSGVGGARAEKTISPAQDQTTEAKAFEAARLAYCSLRKVPLEDRLAALRRLSQVVLQKQEQIIDRLLLENRKSRTDALVSEIYPCLDHLDYLLKEGPRALAPNAVTTPVAMMGKKSEVWLEGLGTVLIIAPWNYPFYQALVPISTALLCGNSVVFKPSEFTPLQGLLEECLREAGIPAHWVQIVYGDGKVGERLIAQAPDKIFFTGSSATGRKILAQAAPLLIPVELELGGKDALIVFEDAQIQRAAKGAVWGAMTNTGQSCTSIERVWVHEKVFDQFCGAAIEEARSLLAAPVGTERGNLGSCADPSGAYDLGQITRPEQVKIIADHLEDALSKGAVLHTGQNWDRKSAVIPPLVLTQVNSKMKCMQEETFGPLMPITVFSSEDEVVGAANRTPYGLAASVWSKDLVRARRVAGRLRCGNVSINNVMITEGNHHLPFGGVGESGMGRYKGKFGLYAFSNIKSVMIEPSSKKIEANWYPYTAEKYQLFSALTRSLFGRTGLRKWIGFAWHGLRLESLSQKLKR